MTTSTTSTARACFTAPRKELLAYFRQLKAAAPTRSPRPWERLARVGINGTVELRAGTRTVSPLSEYADETYLRIAESWDRSGECVALVDPSAVVNTLNASKADTATLAVEGGVMRVECGGGSVSIPCEIDDHATEFPRSAALFSIDAAELRRAVESTEYAADVASTRYALGGICVETGPRGVTFIATDSRRLAAYDAVAEVAPGGDAIFADGSYNAKSKDFRRPGIVLPVGFFARLVKLLPKSGTVEFFTVDRPEPMESAETVTTRLYVAECGPVRVECQPVHGRFPRWRDVVPAKYAVRFEATFDAADMVGACKSALLGTDDENRGVEFTFRGGSVALKAKSAASTCPATFVDPVGDLTVCLDARFVGEPCVMLGKKASVTLGIIDAESAIVMRSGDLTYVVMPLSRDK